MVRILRSTRGVTAGLLIAGLFTFSVGVQSSGVASASSKTPYVIGVPLPMTGAVAASGQEMFNAAKLAAIQLNLKGGILGHKVVLKEQDSACDATTAVNAANLLVSKRVNAIAGEYCSSAGLPEQPIFSRAGLPVVFMGANSPALLTGGYKNNFLMLASGATDAVEAAAFFKQCLKKTVVAVVDDQSAYGVAVANAMQSAVKSNGETLAGGSIQAVPNTQTDFSSVIAAIQSSGATAIFWTGYYAQGALFAKQLSAAGVTASFMASQAGLDPSFITGAGAAATGTFVDTFLTPSSSAMTKFNALYKKNFHSAPGPFSSYAYDAIFVIANAAMKAKSTSTSKVIAALRKTNMVGVTGRIKFSPVGGRLGLPEQVQVVVNGAYSVNGCQPKI
jgi:branched-chain amino acid transport system substrate-binding protein